MNLLSCSICLVGALLQGCAADTSPIAIDDVSSDSVGDEGLQNNERQQAPSEPLREVDAKIATLNVPGGQVIFVDEGLTEPGGGIAFWETGSADLSYLLDVQNATALEIYMAFAPEGAPVPERLVEHHTEVARRVGGIDVKPRHLAVPLTFAGYASFTNQGLGDGNSGSDRDCWGWAGTGNAYSSHYGYQGFNYSDFQDNFNTQYSQISGSFVSSGMDIDTSDRADFGDFLGPTAAGHERAMAFCLSKAIPFESGNIYSDCPTNLGSAKVFVVRTTDSTYNNYTTADTITLSSFGHGGRFRSNYTNSGGAARKYALQVEWPTQPAEGGSINLSCVDELVLAWRSRVIIGSVGGIQSP